MQKRYTPQERYEAKNIKRIVLKLNKKTDADIINAIEESGLPMQTVIKQWIRQAIRTLPASE